MVNYQNGVIYAIRSHQCDDIYIGSTCQPLHKRFHDHKKHYKYWLEGKTNYTSSYEIIKYNDCYIEEIEKYPCNDKQELHKREGQIIRETKNCINKRIAARTYKEFYNDTKEYQKERHQRYYKENKEMILKKQSKQFFCECGGHYTYSHRARHLKTKKHQSFVQTQK